MSTSTPLPPVHPLRRWSFETQDLVQRHPPHMDHENKRTIFAAACPAGSRYAGQLEGSRWPALQPLGSAVGSATSTRIHPRTGYFDYQPVGGAEAMEWHLNFADPDLFFGWSGPLFAQDEIQVAEHPALASFRLALRSAGETARTSAAGAPTPVLVAGVERRCRIAFGPDAEAGRPEGLYGRRFAAARAEDVRAAVTPLQPPSISNILAIAAPQGGSGRYRRAEIASALLTAHSGFRAAVEESARLAGADRPQVVIHTGWWGCGAFGGDRELMASVQMVAAALAGVDRLEFFCGEAGGEEPLERARRRVEAVGDAAAEGWVRTLDSWGRCWGESDGN